MIVCRDVDFAYPGGAPVLRGFSLELPPGKVCAIMGASGGGKTTVLRLLGGQHVASRGQVQVFGQDVAQLGSHDLRALQDAFAAARRETARPTIVIAHTVKGKGVSFMEDMPLWHGSVKMKPEETRTALAELGAAPADIDLWAPAP